jgi:ubiquinone/menaquinone biosynthesis C-methylase UbiE
MSKLSDDYEEIFNSPGGRLVSALEIDLVLELLGYPSKKLILDVGTGTGRVARSLLKLNNDVVGIDISSDRLKLALEKSKKELEGKKNNYHVVMADGQYLPFIDVAFDSIFSIRALKYLKNPNLCFCEIARVLKSHGICVLELSNIFGYEALFLFSLKLFSIKHYAQDMGSSYRLFNIFEVEKTLKTLNLTTISKRGWHKIPTVFFIKCRNFTIVKILLCAESVLQKILPFFLFSRGTLIKAMRVSSN